MPYKLGPWPLGVNNVDDDRSAVFAPNQQRPAQLRDASNVDLDREGWPRIRAGRVKRMDLDSGHSLGSVAGMLLCVSAGNLLAVDTNDWSSRVLGQVGDEPLSYCEAGGIAWVLSRNFRGSIADGQLGIWGLEPPTPPAVSTAAGQLPAGRYQVALTAEATAPNGTLIESGARAATVVELSAPGALLVEPMGLDPATEQVSLYCSEPNGRELYFVASMPVDGAPWRIDQLPQTVALLDGLGERPPPYGQIARSFKGRLLVASGAALFWSGPLAYHNFRWQTDVQLFSDDIVLLEPTLDGFYIATRDQRLMWVGGDDPETWRPLSLNQEMVPEGPAVRVPGSAIPALETSAPVLVWASERGFVAGLPEGQVRWLTDGRLTLPGSGKASLTFREHDGIRQVVLSLREPRAGGSQARFGASDSVECEVIKADRMVSATPAPPDGYQWLMVSDGAGGFEQLMVSDGAGGLEPLAVLED